MNKKKIVVITDCKDIAYMEMRQTLYNLIEINKLSNIEVEPVVEVENFSVDHAAFSIRLLSDLYPAGTVFLVVVSGLATSPARIFGELNNGILFVGNNSGYMNWTIKDIGLKSLYANFTDRKVNGKSFGGKYVQAPTAAALLTNIEFETLGEAKNENFLTDYNIENGTVVHIDNFGLMKVFEETISEFKEGQVLSLNKNGKHILDVTYTESLKTHDDGKWVIFNGSSLHLMPEVGRVRSMNSAAEIDCKVGDVLTWELK